MTHRLWSLAFLGICLFVATQTVQGSETMQKKFTKSFEVELDSQAAEPLKQVDLQEYNVPMPEECVQPGISCHEYTKVKVEVEKTWIISVVPPIESESLTPAQYAVHYEYIDPAGVTPGSPPEQIKLLQRAFYERGLMDSLPTGRFGAQTERAVLHFQQIKDSYESSEDGSIIAGPKTIAAVNTMKERMKDPEYLHQTVVPPFEPEALPPEHQDRSHLLDSFIAADKKGELRQVLVPIKDAEKHSSKVVTQPSAEPMNLEGYVKVMQ